MIKSFQVIYHLDCIKTSEIPSSFLSRYRLIHRASSYKILIRFVRERSKHSMFFHTLVHSLTTHVRDKRFSSEATGLCGSLSSYLGAVTVHGGVAACAVNFFTLVAQPPCRVAAALQAHNNQRCPTAASQSYKCDFSPRNIAQPKYGIDISWCKNRIASPQAETLRKGTGSASIAPLMILGQQGRVPLVNQPTDQSMKETTELFRVVIFGGSSPVVWTRPATLPCQTPGFVPLSIGVRRRSQTRVSTKKANVAVSTWRASLGRTGLTQPRRLQPLHLGLEKRELVEGWIYSRWNQVVTSTPLEANSMMTVFISSSYGFLTLFPRCHCNWPGFVPTQ